MPRKLTWNEQFGLTGCGYAECAWVFQTPSAPAGKSSEEILRILELPSDKEFASHVCASHPKSKT